MAGLRLERIHFHLYLGMQHSLSGDAGRMLCQRLEITHRRLGRKIVPQTTGLHHRYRYSPRRPCTAQSEQNAAEERANTRSCYRCVRIDAQFILQKKNIEEIKKAYQSALYAFLAPWMEVTNKMKLRSQREFCSPEMESMPKIRSCQYIRAIRSRSEDKRRRYQITGRYFKRRKIFQSDIFRTFQYRYIYFLIYSDRFESLIIYTNRQSILIVKRS